MNLNFLCRPSKSLKNGKSPLQLSVIVGKERKQITLDRYVKAQDFNAIKQCVKNDDDLNVYIESIRNRFFEIETEMIRRCMNITPSTLIDVYYNGFVDSNKSVLDLFERHNQEAEAKVERGLIVPATLQKYKLTKRYLESFIKDVLHKSDLSLGTITPSHIEQFYVYLCKYMDKNTAIHKMKLFKKILRIAQEEGYIRAMPFKLKLVSVQLVYDPLTIQEIRKIRNKQFATQRLAEVRDVFVFACYSGLAFTDLKNLTKEHLLVDENGKEWIIKQRQKTKIVSHIPLLPIAKEIWEQYNYHLPVLSNQKYNEYLKEIANCCGIAKDLHSHLARHTFATILLNSGVDIVSVSKVLGHSNSHITEKTYAQLMPETLMNRVTAVANEIV